MPVSPQKDTPKPRVWGKDETCTIKMFVYRRETCAIKTFLYHHPASSSFFPNSPQQEMEIPAMTNDTSEKFQGRVSREPVVNTGRLICKAKGPKHSAGGFRGGFEAKTDRPSKAEETEVLKIFFSCSCGEWRWCRQ